MTDTSHQDRLSPKEPLRIASWNLRMLGQDDDNQAYHRAGSVIIHKLNMPDILAVQELCGTERQADGTVHAIDQAAQLIADIYERSGVAYAYCECPPTHNEDGGAPDKNIRCGYFYRPDRVSLTAPIDDPTSPYLATREADLATDEDGMTRLTNHNPARIRPTDKAMVGTRKPLVAQFTDRETGEQYFITNLHLSADWGLYDAQNPHTPEGAKPRTREESQRVTERRVKQALLVKDFNVSLGDRLYANQETTTTHVAVLGDFNTPWVPDAGRDMPRALQHVEDTGLWQASALLGPRAFSHREGPNTSSIDHAFISRGLRTRLAGIDRPNIASERHRASDHNPLLLTISQERLPESKWIFTMNQTGRVR